LHNGQPVRRLNLLPDGLYRIQPVSNPLDRRLLLAGLPAFWKLNTARATIAAMARKNHVSETPATQWLRAQGVAFTEHVYDYVEHGGTAESSAQLGVPEHAVVKTLVMQDEAARPLVVLMHGDRTVSTKNLARAIGAKSVEPCRPEVAQRHSGYLVGGTSPFGFRKDVPVYVQETILALPRILINGGRRGYLVGMPPAVLTDKLRAKPVQCAN
jgi:Cys-tRNA(Pro) deacylase